MYRNNVLKNLEESVSSIFVKYKYSILICLLYCIVFILNISQMCIYLKKLTTANAEFTSLRLKKPKTMHMYFTRKK